MDRPLRVSRLIVKDFMRIQAIDIRPGNKTLVILKGDNEQGKTSAERALISVLGGKKYDPDEPIRRGADNGIVDITLADDVAARLRATVSYTSKGRYLTVRQIDDGTDIKLQGGQGILDDLVGALAFSPLKFMRQDDKGRLAMLMQAIGKADAYEQLQHRRLRFYEQRTDVNRQLREVAERAKTWRDPSPDQELVERPSSDIQLELNKVQAAQAEVNAYAAKVAKFQLETANQRRDREGMVQEVTRLELRIAELQAAIKDADAVLAERDAKYAQATAELERRQAAIPGTEVLTRQFSDLQTHNQRVIEQREARKVAAELQKRTRESEQLTQALDSIDAEVRSLLTASDIGKRVPGLAIDAQGCITHNDVPISQASGMRQLELSCLVGMALDRQLRVMCIDEGDQLDAASLQRLKELAQQHDYQVWMTAVYAGNGDNLEHLVPIHDGTVLGAPTPETPRTGKAAPPPIPPNEDVAEMYTGLPIVATVAAPGGNGNGNSEPVNLDELEL